MKKKKKNKTQHVSVKSHPTYPPTATTPSCLASRRGSHRHRQLGAGFRLVWSGGGAVGRGVTAASGAADMAVRPSLG